VGAPAAGAGRLIDWAAIRADHPGAVGRAYLDTSCKGLPSGAAVAAVAAHLDRLRESPGSSATGETVAMLDQFERARAAAARLIGASRREIALVPSTAEGIAALARSLPLERGANVVASDLEFAGGLLPWAGAGCELRFAPHRGGVVEVADLEAAIDRRTAAVVISSVQELNGFRVDLDGLVEACHRRGVLVVVDGIQQVGRIEIDVAATGVDALAVGGHKWLGAPFGMGFLYVSAALFERLRPPARSLMTALPPGGGWDAYLESAARHPGDELAFPDDARRLEAAALGTTISAAGLAAAIEVLLEIGVGAIEERSAGLLDRAREALEACGAEVLTPASSAPTSILTFRTSTDVDDDRELVRALAEASVLTSLRGSTGIAGIRVSPFLYNDEHDVDLLARIVGRRLRRPR
jgi:selenocysteine lyase/cysteine desulfurase